MSDERLRELLEVQTYFGLPSPALVEKDFYVVKMLAAIGTIDTATLRLVFGGGTALSIGMRSWTRISALTSSPPLLVSGPPLRPRIQVNDGRGAPCYAVARRVARARQLLANSSAPSRRSRLRSVSRI